MNSLVFLLITTLSIIFSWIYVIYCYIRKKNLSNAYGILAITYITHALSLQVLGLPSGFYIGFSILWIFFHTIFRKTEKNKSEKDEQ